MTQEANGPHWPIIEMHMRGAHFRLDILNSKQERKGEGLESIQPKNTYLTAKLIV